MIGILFFGLILGMMAAALSKDFNPRNIIGWVIIATFGALEGRFIASLLSLNQDYVPALSAACTVMGAILLISIKLMIRPKEYPHQLA